MWPGVWDLPRPAIRSPYSRVESLFAFRQIVTMGPDPAVDRLAGEDFNDIDRHFADLMLRLEQRSDPALWLAAALTSRSAQDGHVCLDLSAVGSLPVTKVRVPEDWSFHNLRSLEWEKSLIQSKVVGRPGDFSPLVLDKAHRLYLYRYWQYEHQVVEFLEQRVSRGIEEVNPIILQSGLDRLFPIQTGKVHWQRVAAIMAVLRSFCVIAGGPGTGKTSTVVKILALLIEQAAGRKLSIALAAPTGKAAARMKEAVRAALGNLNVCGTVLELIPQEAFTLHRLLGTIPGSSSSRYDGQNLLPYDVIVVDEASMVDLRLMAKLIQAVRSSCRVLLLGDRDQLASVEPGSVFGDICDAASGTRFSGPLIKLAEEYGSLDGETAENLTGSRQEPGLEDTLVLLRESFRFKEESGIANLSRAIQEEDRDEVKRLLTTGTEGDLRWEAIDTPFMLSTHLERWVRDAYSGYLKESSASEAFARFSQNRILCALRRGPFGVDAVNLLAQRVLERNGLIHPEGRWYAGQPILITRNDYQVRLFNGDVGLVLRDLETGELVAYFPAEDGGFRKILLSKLPDHETVFAMTVHKSQGSEFDRVLLLLPNQSSEVLTRELIYTGVTRARRQIQLWGNLEVFLESISKRISRNSGLRDALCNR